MYKCALWSTPRTLDINVDQTSCMYKNARSIYTAVSLTNPCQNRRTYNERYKRTWLFHHTCAQLLVVQGPAANVAYNMSRLHPSSQRSKTMQNYSKTLLVAKYGFSLLRSAILCVSVHGSRSPYHHVHKLFSSIYRPWSCVLKQRANFARSTQLLSVYLHVCLTSHFSIMLFKNTVCVCAYF